MVIKNLLTSIPFCEFWGFSASVSDPGPLLLQVIDPYPPASEGVAAVVLLLHPLPLSLQQLVLRLRLDLHEVSTLIRAESPRLSVGCWHVLKHVATVSDLFEA